VMVARDRVCDGWSIIWIGLIFGGALRGGK
jgi:hypothetical protein